MANEDIDYFNASDNEEDEDERYSQSDVEEDDYGYEYHGQDDDSGYHAPQDSYYILSETDILDRQAECIVNVSSVLSLPKADAAILLRHFKWVVSRVNDEWFQDEELVRKTVGLSNTPGRLPFDLTCGICFDTQPSESLLASRCKLHYFCLSCWEGYIQNAIHDGPGCLTLRCPDPSCSSAVGEEMVLPLASGEYKAKYIRYLLRSYVDDNRKVKWCPAPGCEYAVEYIPGSLSFDIVCKCGHGFCWNCLEEAHRPVDCETVTKWIQKNSAESENMNWILANSKPCPRCKRPIEKNQGCMHMTCTPPCRFEFCWLCLGVWSEHGERTGGFYACNRYETARSEGVYDESERRREMAKNSLERYTHYYERWSENEASRKKAIESLKKMQTQKIEDLSNKQCQPVAQLKFVLEAWAQIIECRRVLKWTYSYGYYLPENQNARRHFFEYLQGEAEAGLERLHTCAENELEGFLSGTATASFNEFRTKLAGLTSVTHTYFENLVAALENGLKDVNNVIEGKSNAVSAPLPGRVMRNFSRARSSSFSNASYWPCPSCTLANLNHLHYCAACHEPRPN